MSFFQTSVEKKYLNDLDQELIDLKYCEFQKYFSNPEIQENIRNAKEEQFQEGFLRKLFVEILGYILNPDPQYNLTTELKNISDSKKADGAILKNGDAIAVIELKSTDTTDLKTIETQAFGYKNQHHRCDYVITSNFEKLRFYIRNAVSCLEFNLFKLQRNEFALMWLCLAKDNLLYNLPLKIKEASLTQEENITKQLYTDYSIFREAIYSNLVKNNPDEDRLMLFKKTQKLLDRFLFILFAEDKLLLPPNSLNDIVQKWIDLKDKYDEYIPLYERFKKYFGYLNTGYKSDGQEIFPYNGGLFAPDETLDNVSIDDSILQEHTIKLSNYDFNTEVDVNILGHIFEHSLGVIEGVEAEIRGEKVAQERTKRKKDGIFYTPKYVTKYIVENTVGKLCEDKRKDFGIVDEEYAKGRKNRKKDIIKRLHENLNSYQEWLKSITILDPACGSGAFLNQALEFLIEEHQKIDELRVQLLGGSIVLSDVTPDILENNIYGVDLNEESVEIAKLSLWLRTAKKGRKLSTLSNNIKCGNSLIDDPAVAGEKAFNWEKEFPEIFANGGFDVVIGNPPYVQFFENQSYYDKSYATSKCGDLYALFFEKGLEILKYGGLFSFITPSLFIKGIRYNSLRSFLLKNTLIVQIKDQGDGVFENVQMPTAIFTAIKMKNSTQDWNAFIPGGNIVLKIEKKSIPFASLCKIKRGMEIGKDKVVGYNPSLIKILTGEDVSRYLIKRYQSVNLTTFNEFKKEEEFFNGERLVIRETGNRITCLYIDESVQQNRSLYSILIENKDVDYKYVLGIINSSLIQFYYRSKFAANTDIFPKIRIAQVKELPIIIVKKENQIPLIDKVDEIIKDLSLQNDLHKNFIFFLRSKLNIKSSYKMEKMFDLDFCDFLPELKKSSINIDLNEEAKWLNYFREQKQKSMDFRVKISKTDKQIDQMVYELYGLTKEEIQIVEESLK